MDKIEVTRLTLADAHRLAPLLAAYTQDQKRGAPRAPDEYYAELLLKDPIAEIAGASRGTRLLGFAVYVDLPDTMTGLRVGQLNDLFVIQDAREQGVGRALVTALIGRRHAAGLAASQMDGAGKTGDGASARRQDGKARPLEQLCARSVTPRAATVGMADERRKADAIETWATGPGRTLGHVFMPGLAARLVATCRSK